MCAGVFVTAVFVCVRSSPRQQARDIRGCQRRGVTQEGFIENATL
jgi:hypothetical protein